MKTFILLLTLVTSLSASAICNREAQFLGTVTNVRQYSDISTGEPVAYTFQVKLGYQGRYFFSPSSLCALWEDELESAVVMKKGVSPLVNGQSISGIMVFDEAKNKYSIE